MGSPDAFQHIRAPVTLDPSGNLKSQPLFIGQADIKNCFYQCSLPELLQPFFGLDSVGSDFVKSLGVTSDSQGLDISDDFEYFPILQVLPMGWSWSQFIV